MEATEERAATVLPPADDFRRRHIGPSEADRKAMLDALGYKSLDALIDAAVPAAIRLKKAPALPAPASEAEALAELRRTALKNQVWRSYLGQGYHDTITPPVILREVLENAGWYTAYTPYQPEIAQGRLEALLNFQTLVIDLTGLPVANASLLDEGTAAAEAMALCLHAAEDPAGRVFFVDERCHPQTIEVVRTRAEPLGVELFVGDPALLAGRKLLGALVQYPDTRGAVKDWAKFADEVHGLGGLLVVAADPLALTLFKSPGEFGADIAVGSTQRFGVPMGFGGPHAAYMAAAERFARRLPGRIVGVSKDARGKPALRLALQTREQHIRREKATSNICTAQVLLAVIAAMYAVYHGPEGLTRIASRVRAMTLKLRASLKDAGYDTGRDDVFDTLCVSVTDAQNARISAAARFSPSKLSTYQNCPKKYQYRYVDRISRKRKTPETVLGVAVHAAFEELHGLVNGGKLPTLAEVQAVYEAELAKEWDETVKLRDERFSKDDWRRVGLDCVKNYYEAGAPFDKDKTVAVEKKVGFPIATEEGEYRIEGFVDRLVLAKDGAFEVHDYKTAKSLPSQADMDADWQLALYELAIRHEWPDTKDVRLRWHYVRHGKVITSVRDAAARERLRAEAAALIASIKRDHEFPPKVTPLCDWCEYKDLCPEFAHAEKVAALPPAERRKDDGVKLADAFAEVEERRKKIASELKAAEAEKRLIEAKLVAWAEGAGLSTVAGSDAEVHVTRKDDIELPAKSRDPEKHDALEKEARALPLWEDVAKLDGHALVEGVKAKRWAGELLTAAEALLERYGKRVVKSAARLRRRRDADED